MTGGAVKTGGSTASEGLMWWKAAEMGDDKWLCICGDFECVCVCV